jgi:hypothetical protein
MTLEQFANKAITTLAANINDSTTDITVASATGFPSTVQYRITINSEIMLVTAGAGTTTWTVTRGAESTVAAAHTSGDAVSHVLTAESMDKAVTDIVLGDTGSYDGTSISGVKDISTTGNITASGSGSVSSTGNLNLFAQLRMSGFNILSKSGNDIAITGDSNVDDVTIGAGGSTKVTVKETGEVGIGVTAPDSLLDVNGAMTLRELSADPADPDEGSMVMWMSNGVGVSGDDGDIMLKITAGATTKTITLVDFSAS